MLFRRERPTSIPPSMRAVRRPPNQEIQEESGNSPHLHASIRSLLHTSTPSKPGSPVLRSVPVLHHNDGETET